MFTTRERVDSEISYRIKNPDGTLEPLVREVFFVMVYESLSHRKDALEAATALTDTIFGTIHRHKTLVVDQVWLHQHVYETLRRFDKPAAVRYKATHMN